LSGREAMLCQLLPVPRGTPVQGSNTAFKRGRVEVCLQPEHGTPDKVCLMPENEPARAGGCCARAFAMVWGGNPLKG
jgi:hypothetical protein